MTTLLKKMNEAKQVIEKKLHQKPQIGLILGSGLGDLANEIQNPVVIDYKEIPHFPISTVEGHAGKLVVGELNGKAVVAMQGRFHFYEGYSMQEVTFPVRVMKALGVECMLITNACGGMNKHFHPGDLMLITDHMNMTGVNPLVGPNDSEMGPRFPDMSRAYTPELVELVSTIAKNQDIQIQKGVYAGITGPSYMTKSELIMLRKLGADAIGMSTVPEVIVASHMGMKIIGLSCITDMAIGEELEPLTHEQVVEVANRTKPKFMTLVKQIISNL